jgi:anti-sigma28 factor (negative regulator of flagellin synthesis)
MSIGHKRPSETFKQAVSQIERSRMTQSAATPTTATPTKETHDGVRNERQREEGERRTEEIAVPIADTDVVSASSGSSSGDWKARVEALKKRKPAKKDE